MKFLIKSLCGFAFIALLSACGSESGGTATNGIKKFEDPNFSINYPTDWIVKTRQNFGADIPKETIVTFSASEPVNGYRQTISVINDIVPPQTTSMDYAKANINNAVKSILDFEKMEERNVTISEEETKLLIFKGKSNLNAKTLKYIQLYVVKGELGYTITASDLLDIEENDFKILQDLVLSFELKNE